MNMNNISGSDIYKLLKKELDRYDQYALQSDKTVNKTIVSMSNRLFRLIVSVTDNNQKMFDGAMKGFAKDFVDYVSTVSDASYGLGKEDGWEEGQEDAWDEMASEDPSY